MNMKKIVLIISFIFSLFLFIISIKGTYYYCGGVYGICVEMFHLFSLVFFPILSLFLFSLVTYFMREEIFQVWWKFARVWIPLSMIAIILAPSYASDFMFPVDKGRVAFFASSLFLLTSLILIIRTKWKLQK